MTYKSSMDQTSQPCRIEVSIMLCTLRSSSRYDIITMVQLCILFAESCAFFHDFRAACVQLSE